MDEESQISDKTANGKWSNRNNYKENINIEEISGLHLASAVRRVRSRREMEAAYRAMQISNSMQLKEMMSPYSRPPSSLSLFFWEEATTTLNGRNKVAPCAVQAPQWAFITINHLISTHMIVDGQTKVVEWEVSKIFNNELSQISIYTLKLYRIISKV